ncbi:sorting nexin-17 isoform X2 [Prorops nasuta]|uniref:sorting nexin-17 isoform X2 n=1 Tax=Prorops nasuta TaxID=863751 RepID=UPI0034CE6023
MHFSIPDTQEYIDGSGNSYVGYRIHINGLYHCTVRYKQLYSLHEQLTKDLIEPSFPVFPPKKFFPLTINQQEERRLCLEKYIQSIGQNPTINKSEILNGFLLNAQLESSGGSYESKNLDIYLMSGREITIYAYTGDNSTCILKVYEFLSLPEEYCLYFALFVVFQDEIGNFNVLRKLEDFESPLITLSHTRVTGSKIVLAKGYWDIEYDLYLSRDSVATDLLYAQAVAEVRRGWIVTTNETKDVLIDLQKREKKRNYLNLARSLKYYGYIQFASCFCDYPGPNSQVLVAIGGNELNLRVIASDKYDEVSFKVTRMRCWRVTTLQSEAEEPEDNAGLTGLELSFEYLMAKNQLQWITVASGQAILMSVCLQAMIDELLSKTAGITKRQCGPAKSWTYITRDGNSRINISNGPIVASIDSTNGSDGSSSSGFERTCLKNNDGVDSPLKAGHMIKKITRKLSTGTVKKSSEQLASSILKVRRKSLTSTTTEYDMENNAFHLIGDDDL